MHMIVHVFEEEKEIQKLHMIVHVFGVEKEILEIAYDSPRFWSRERNSRN